MHKNIILLSDGTGNSAAKFNKTNVWRLYQALDLSKRDSTAQLSQQIAYYDDGVGTSTFKPLALLGGAFGVGLKSNVIDLYVFLCRNYEQGDEIYCFGFSRGAYTIRVLMGLIAHEGLIRPDYSESEMRHLAEVAYSMYRDERYQGRYRLLERLIHFNLSGKKKAYKTRQQEKKESITVESIAFVGLWDTVAAYGLPFDALTRAWSWLIPLSMPDRTLGQMVQRACHALCLDDERGAFHPVLWDEEHEPQNAQHIQDERISQVWFTGMHSNVGGGYPDDALSYLSLDWIMGEAERANPLKNRSGLVFKKNERDNVQSMAHFDGKIEDSRSGLGGAYLYAPRKLKLLTYEICSATNKVIISRPKVHWSVFERIYVGSNEYAPIGLPAHYAVVTKEGSIIDLPQPGMSGSMAIEDAKKAQFRAHCQENIWDIVWEKRLIYFASVIPAIMLMSFPLLPPLLCNEGWGCVALSPAIANISKMLPDFLSPWLTRYQSYPVESIGLILILSGLLYGGNQRQSAIFWQMRTLWKNTGTVRAASHSSLYRIRSSAAYHHFFKFLNLKIFPLVAGILVVFLACVRTMPLALLMCKPTSKEQLITDSFLKYSAEFPNKEFCWASKIQVAQGKRYRLTIHINPPDKAHELWTDHGIIKPGIGGFGPALMKPIQYVALPMLRRLGEPYFQLIARVGNDEYPLTPANGTIPNQDTRTLVADITVHEKGELFVFVNDAMLPFPWQSWQPFYNNNQGSASLVVSDVSNLVPE